MAALPTDEWAATLDRMTATIKTSLAALDRYQAEWSSLAELRASEVTPEQLFEWLERRLGQWDAKLTEAAGVAASVEGQLGERETALGRWNQLLVRWCDLIQQKVDPTAALEGSRTVG